MKTLKGFNAKYRQYFSKLSGSFREPFTIDQASKILDVPHPKAKHILIRLTNSGWLYRIKQGLYLPIPGLIEGENVILEDPWILANSIFRPCYIGGWDAVSYWDLTEQIFNDTFIYTQNPQKKSHHEYLNHKFVVHKIPEEQFFGLHGVWKENIKVMLSDPTRTIIDFLNTPHFFGGSQTLNDVFSEYLRSEHCDIERLLTYALKMKNKAILKRLGFLLEYNNLLTKKVEEMLHQQLSLGKVKFVPTQDCPKLITKWRLWVPAHWKGVDQ